VRVTLEWYETELAIDVGVRRSVSSWKKNRKHSAGLKPTSLFDLDVRGAAAECAVAKALGIYWDGSVDTFKTKADLGENIEIRSTKTNPPKLIVRPNDGAEKIYVCVQDEWLEGQRPTYLIHGWMTGTEAMDDQYLTNFGRKDRPPCYGVPAENLHDVSEKW
jgi:hypothetical protein